MTTARLVPVTTEMDGDELDAMDAWHLARQHGLKTIAVESFVRFRYGDGFTNSRALALHACLAVVPFLLALTGLAADLDEERPAKVVAHVVDSLSPGAGDSDALSSAVEKSDEAERAGEVALVFGRTVVLTGVLAGPVGIGFLMIVGGGAFGQAMADNYGWSPGTVQWWNVLRWPIGLSLLLWALLSSVALFLGTAVCAQLEAVRAGKVDPALADPGGPHARTVADRTRDSRACDD